MFDTITDVLQALRNGEFIVLVDDEDRENEGDLIIPAQFVSPEALTFMLREAAGYLFVALTEADCDRLNLTPQTPNNTSVRGTPFTVSVDGHPKHGFTTGVSAQERADSIRWIIKPDSTPDDFVRPGHINPLRARDGGVLVRTGHTEGSVDLCRLAGLTPAAVGIEIMRPDGQMARLPDLMNFAAEHKIRICSIEQLIEHRLQRESLVKRIPPAQGTPLQTAFGTFNLIAYDSLVDPFPHIALTVGGVGELDATGKPIVSEKPTLVRMHRRDLLGDVFHDLASASVGPSAAVLHNAMRRILDHGHGAIVYMRPEGIGDALPQRLLAINRREHQPPQDAPELTSTDGVGARAVPMHQRDFGIGGQILRDLGLTKLRLMTNTKKELPGLDAFSLEIVEYVDLG